MIRTLSIAALLSLGACAAHRPAQSASAVAVAPEPPRSAWRGRALPEDAARIDAIEGTWRAALAEVTRGKRAALAAEGPLVDGMAALDHPALPPGAYKCRLLRVGEGAGRGGVTAFPSFFCNIGTGGEDGALSFSKQTGSDLPAGWLHADGDHRYVFLGARQAKAGDTSLVYGADRAKDVAGVVERIGPFRWRLTVPSAPAKLDVYELTPVPVEAQPG